MANDHFCKKSHALPMNYVIFFMLYFLLYEFMHEIGERNAEQIMTDTCKVNLRKVVRREIPFVINHSTAVSILLSSFLFCFVLFFTIILIKLGLCGFRRTGLVCHDWIMKIYNGSLLFLENDCLFLNISFHCLGVNRTIKFFFARYCVYVIIKVSAFRSNCFSTYDFN